MSIASSDLFYYLIVVIFGFALTYGNNLNLLIRYNIIICITEYRSTIRINPHQKPYNENMQFLFRTHVKLKTPEQIIICACQYSSFHQHAQVPYYFKSCCCTKIIPLCYRHSSPFILQYLAYQDFPLYQLTVRSTLWNLI